MYVTTKHSISGSQRKDLIVYSHTRKLHGKILADKLVPIQWMRRKQLLPAREFKKFMRLKVWLCHHLHVEDLTLWVSGDSQVGCYLRVKPVGLCRRIIAYCADKKTNADFEVSISSGKGIENGSQNLKIRTLKWKATGCVYIYVCACVCSCVCTIMRCNKVDSCLISGVRYVIIIYYNLETSITWWKKQK